MTPETAVALAIMFITVVIRYYAELDKCSDCGSRQLKTVSGRIPNQSTVK